MKRVLGTIAALVAVQAALLGAWWAVEQARSPAPAPAAGPLVEAGHGEQAPPLRMQRPDGGEVALASLRGRPVVLHFWATWCPPCRTELPDLLAWEGGGAEVLAVSTDPSWGRVHRFLDGLPADRVLRADGERVAAAFGVAELPATLLLAPDGRVVGTIDGARDWTDPALHRAIRQHLEAP